VELEELALIGPELRRGDEALRLNLSRSLIKINDLFEGEARLLVKVLLARWDVENIKALLRGKAAKVTEEEILLATLPASEIDAPVLRELACQPDIKACIDLLATFRIIYARPLLDAFKNYLVAFDLGVFDLALDKFWAQSALSVLKKGSYNRQILAEMVRAEVDCRNIITLLRLVKEGESAKAEGAGFFIEGGKEINLKIFLSLLRAEEVEELVSALSRFEGGEALEAAREESALTGSLSPFEREIEKFLLAQALRLARQDPLSIGVVIGYLWAKYAEVKNLRLILRGKVAGMPLEEIRKELIRAETSGFD